MRPARGQRFTKEAPVARLVGEPEWPGAVQVEGLSAVRALTDRPVKVTLPGPMTLVDSLHDEEYGPYRRPTLPCLRRPAEPRGPGRWPRPGQRSCSSTSPLQHLSRPGARLGRRRAGSAASAGVGTKTGVHICYGYGGSEVPDWKAANRDWSHYEASLALVARTDIDQVSIETAAVGVDIGVIKLLRGKDVLLGLVNVGDERVQTPEQIAGGLRRALSMSGRTGCSPAPTAASSCAAAKRPRRRCGRWRPEPRSSTGS